MESIIVRRLRIQGLLTKSSLQRIELLSFRTSSDREKEISPRGIMLLSILLVFEQKGIKDAMIYSYLIFLHLESNH